MENPSHRATLRAVVVIALAAFTLAIALPDIQRIWHPIGTFGWVADYDYYLTSVDANSVADKAGLKVGDRIDMAATKPEYRYYAAAAETLLPGQQISMVVARGKQRRVVTVASEPEPMDATKEFLIVARELELLLFVGIGAALVLLRPSVATWGFYFYCLGLNGAPSLVSTLALSMPWNYIVEAIYGFMIQAGFVGAAVFASLFLHEQGMRWRGIVYRAAPFAVFILFGLVMYSWLGTSWFGWPGDAVATLLLCLQAVTVVVAMYAFIETYVLARGSERQRIRWVILGFGIALVAFVVDQILNFGFFKPPYWLHGSLLLAGVVVPLTVGYAVIKHRVIDVSFVVSRALVYGILTTLLVGAFSLIDWFFTDYLRLARLGTFAEVGAVVGFGLWFNGLHRRVDSFIDATFFRQRHRAEVQLARAAVALPLVTTASAVAHFIVREPVRALELASAAVFRRRRDGVYYREASEGWDADNLVRLDENDEPLLALAQAERGPISLYDRTWRSDEVPKGAARPVVALPIIVRRELGAIVFYGSHVHGEALDPDEVKAIAGLATGAAAAYDHLEAEAMRREVESLRSVISGAQTQPV